MRSEELKDETAALPKAVWNISLKDSLAPAAWRMGKYCINLVNQKGFGRFWELKAGGNLTCIEHKPVGAAIEENAFDNEINTISSGKVNGISVKARGLSCKSLGVL